MILSRLKAAIKEQNWFAVVLEVCIVIVGVVIGFQITAWGNERSERAREQVLLNGLLADFVANQERYGKIATEQELTVNQMKALLPMTGPSPDEPDPAVFDSLLSSLITWENLNLTVGRVDALLGSGQIALIQNDSLQAALSTWPSTLEDMHENEMLVVADAKNALSYLSTRYPLLTVDNQSGLLDSTLTNTFPENRRSILADLEFANLVENRLVNTLLLTQDSEPVRRLIEDTIQLIESELNR